MVFDNFTDWLDFLDSLRPAKPLSGLYDTLLLQTISKFQRPNSQQDLRFTERTETSWHKFKH